MHRELSRRDVLQAGLSVTSWVLTRFAYHAGWRKTEILTLEWRDIHGDMIRLRSEIAKNQDGRVIVIVGEVANIIAYRQAERVESCPYVFTERGSGLSTTTGPGGWHGRKLDSQGSSFTMPGERRCGIWTERVCHVRQPGRSLATRPMRCIIATG
jgi:integrase